MATTSKATWIWYPGDYEIWLGNKMNNRRTERGAFFPPFWKTDSHFVTVEFSTVVELAEAEEVTIAAEGIFNIKLDGKLQFGMPEKFLLPAGKHNLNIKVWNQATPPALYVEGKTVYTDASWRVTFEDKEWIDESGKASDTSATIYMQAGAWNFGREERPSLYKLCREALPAVAVTEADGGKLYDFGRETFGYLVLEGVEGDGEVAVYYGESPEEAQDKAFCETLDRIRFEATTITDLATGKAVERTARYVFDNSKALRYVYVECEGATPAGVSLEYEYAPVTYRGSFKSNDEELNRIWEIGAYTMHLTTREFFIDGIKRDRWVWSGDAVQSYLMNYYLFFDSECVKRTTWLLRGKDPVTAHTNTIMDYTFYWFIGIYDYYMYTGDRAFVKQIYPRMQTMMEYVLGRTNSRGMVEGMTGDWVFVDWADGYLDKKGELAIEQVLLCKSLETMALCAALAEVEEDIPTYEKLAAELRAKLLPTFWNEAKQAMVHNCVEGEQSEAVTRYANMFATFFGYLSEEQQQQIKHSVLLNDEILKITTPYMRFYELEALCVLGEQEAVMGEMKDYWGGMLREGATSFWEKYNPTESGTQHLAMYGRPYGKSLCHAWGASPIYLLGRYYLGVKPTKAGYASYEVRPTLGGLEWMEGTIPTPNGEIRVKMDKQSISVYATEGEGVLHLPTGGDPIRIECGKELTINY
ncbi:MAG: alpha-rhamnosidase [Rikenellaceae bacterium]|nr:alpha-rhamnosidase [Rikenellaceae bacterium]